MREHCVVTAIGNREIGWSEGSGLGHGEKALQPLDFSNGLFSVHTYQSSMRNQRYLKQKRGLTFCPLPQMDQWDRMRLPKFLPKSLV